MSAQYFARRHRTAYDFGAVTTLRHLPWLFLVVACASPMSALRDDNRKLTQTVTDLRSDRRSQERKLRDLQHQLDSLRDKGIIATAEGPLPTLPVEVAAPPARPAPAMTIDGERVVGVTDDGTEIVYEGDAAAGKQATIPVENAPVHRVAAAPRDPDDDATPDRIEVVHRAPPPAAARVARGHLRDSQPGERATAGGDAPGEYRAAVELLKAGHHDEAVTALHAFLVKYPRHDYADNAQYWLGEAAYAQKDFAHALTEFRTVIETYPRGNKVPDALLKVGYCYQALGQADKARAVLEQVVNLYPKTEPAVLAAKRLESQ
jgi:tol-pal system protein YbgF